MKICSQIENYNKFSTICCVELLILKLFFFVLPFFSTFAVYLFGEIKSGIEHQIEILIDVRRANEVIKKNEERKDEQKKSWGMEINKKKVNESANVNGKTHRCFSQFLVIRFTAATTWTHAHGTPQETW